MDELLRQGSAVGDSSTDGTNPIFGRFQVMRPVVASSFFLAATLSLFLMPASASAQELEPGAYWPIPTGLNIVTLANNFNWGDVAFDPSAPIDEASATVQHHGVRVYAGVQPGRTIGERGSGVARGGRSCGRHVFR